MRDHYYIEVNDERIEVTNLVKEAIFEFIDKHGFLEKIDEATWQQELKTYREDDDKRCDWLEVEKR